VPKALPWLRHGRHRFWPWHGPRFIPRAPMLPTHRAGARRPISSVRLQPWSPSGRFHLKSSRLPRLVTRWPSLSRPTTAARTRSTSFELSSTVISSGPSIAVSANPLAIGSLPSAVPRTTCRNVASSRRSRRIPEDMLEARKLCKGCPSGAGIPNWVSIPARRIARTTRGLSKKTCEPRMQRGTS
jgi:hypothetical protein